MVQGERGGAAATSGELEAVDARVAVEAPGGKVGSCERDGGYAESAATVTITAKSRRPMVARVIRVDEEGM